MKKTDLRLTCVLIFIASLGCASNPPAASPKTPEEEVSARARTYWKIRQRKDLGGMYAFYSAGYRSRHTRDDFIRKTRLIRFDILDFKIDEVTVSGERADVTTAYRTYSPPKLMDPVHAKVTEKWIRDPDGQWYKERETILLPFPGKLGTPEEVED